MPATSEEKKAGLPTAAASGRPLSMNGKEYTISPLTAKQWGSIAAWVQQTYVELAVNAAACLPEDQRNRIFWEAVREASMFNHKTPFFQEMIRSPLGTSRVLWMGFRKHHPEVTLQEVEDWIGEDAVRVCLLTCFNLANDVDGEAPPDGSPKAGVPQTTG